MDIHKKPIVVTKEQFLDRWEDYANRLSDLQTRIADWERFLEKRHHPVIEKYTNKRLEDFRVEEQRLVGANYEEKNV